MLVVVIFKDNVTTYFKWILHFFKGILWKWGDGGGGVGGVINFLWCVSVFFDGTSWISFHCFSRRGNVEAGGEEMASDARRLKKLWIQDLIWTDKLLCLICSFVFPAWREKETFPLGFSPASSLPLSHAAPLHPTLNFSLSLTRWALPVRGRFFDIAARKQGLLQEEGLGRRTPRRGANHPWTRLHY